MHFACEHNMPGVALQLAKLLRSHGASISSLDEELHTPLFNACAAGNLQLAQWLHSEGAEMEQATSHDEGCGTPFLVAVMNGDESVARWLAQVGAEVKAHDSDGRGALHLAAMSGHLDLVVWLHEEHGLSIHAKDNDGETPLIASCSKTQIEVVQWLLTKGARDERTPDGFSADG